MITYRDIEVFEGLRRDDLALIMSCRSEKLLTDLPPDDTNPILMNEPSPLMVAAFFGATKCFKYLLTRVSTKYLDQFVPIFFYFSKFN